MRGRLCFSVLLVFASLIAGCGPARDESARTAQPAPVIPADPEPGNPTPVPVPALPEKPTYLIRPVPMTDADWKDALASNYPDVLRGGKTDRQLAAELQREVFAFEFTAPFTCWVEVQEVGQETIPQRRPGQGEWEVRGSKGRFVFSVGRGASERMKAILQRVGKDAFPESIGFQLQVSKSDYGNSFLESHGGNPLWYGWKGTPTLIGTEHRITADPPKGTTFTILAITAEETVADAAKQVPRKATLSLKGRAGVPPLPEPKKE